MWRRRRAGFVAPGSAALSLLGGAVVIRRAALDEAEEHLAAG